MEREKVVYVLGAGFSKGVGAPLQSEIMRDIFLLKIEDLSPQYRILFFEYRSELEKLLTEVFYLQQEDFQFFQLEDLYSSLDRCIIDNISLRRFNRSELIEIRQKINALIVILLDHKLKSGLSKPYVSQFAKYLIQLRRNLFIDKKDQESDPFTIISTNWDIVLENEIDELLDQWGILDYCFYVHYYSPNLDQEIDRKWRSGLYARGQGKYNIKILKLHGSTNWLQCPRCQRVFIAYSKKISLDEFLTKSKCYYCEKKFSDGVFDSGALLKSSIIMPTFLKDLNNFNLKLSWQITGIELQEATKIVFMGYSFPLADFELRHLFARSIRLGTEIDVVLQNSDNPGYEEPYSTGQYFHDQILHLRSRCWSNYKSTPEFRYMSFFGSRTMNFFYAGVENYISEHCQ